MHLQIILLIYLSFVHSGVSSKNASEVNTLIEASNVGKVESTGHIRLERSKTERHRHNNLCAAEEAAQIFDDKISVQQKVKFM